MHRARTLVGLVGIAAGILSVSGAYSVLGVVDVSNASGEPVPAPTEAGEWTEILRAADHARGNLGGVSWRLQVESTERDKTRRIEIDARARGYDFLGELVSPAKIKGQKLLLISGTMWFHRPGLSKPVPISRRQRLLGQAAYGDIAATNYADEYEPTLAGEDSTGGETCWIFDLVARDPGTTYDRIRYWVSQERGVGLRAEYYSVSGKLLKSATMAYDHRYQKDAADHPFISSIAIEDAIAADRRTTLFFGPPEFKPLPDYLFNVGRLAR